MDWQSRHTLLTLAIGAFFLTLFVRLVLSPVVPAIIDAFDSSKSAIGLAFTGMWAAYALVQYPGGVLGDRFGEYRLILLSIGLTGLSGLLLALSVSYGFFVVAAILLGASAGLYGPAGTSLLAKSFRNTGQALGLHVAGANVAGLIAPVAGAYVGIRYGWRAAPVLGIALAVPLFVAFAWYAEPTEPSQPERSIRAQFTPKTLLEVLLRPSIAYTMGLGIIGVFTFQAIASFLPTFLIEFWGLTTQRAGTAFGIVYLFSAMTMPITGRVSDVTGRDLTITFSFLTVASGLGILLAGRMVVPALVAVVVVGIGISWGGVLHSRYMDHLDDAERGTGFGLVRTVTGLVGSLGSVVVGSLAEFAGWQAAYSLVIGLLLIAITALLANRALKLGL